MLKHICILSLLCLAVRARRTACPANEVYSECGNNACQNTCENPNIGMYCKPICTPGCICIEGYLRNTQGVCVPACQCDTCKKNEVFHLTGNTECVNTCNEPDKSSTCVPAVPLAGCICRKGYVRNGFGDCIRRDKCSCDGDPNTYLEPCDSFCPEGRVCIQACRTVCKCRKGFAKDKNGICKPLCPGKNEFFSCGSACDTTCATLGEKCPIINIKCTDKCYCIEGYARNSKGECIPISQCPPRICKNDSNAIIVPCGDPCPITCDNKDNIDSIRCPKICIVNGCKCKKGYVLGPKLKCIKPEHCPCPLKCGKNEEYVKCPTPEKTCQNYFIGLDPVYQKSKENLVECKPACRCKSGYLRNDKGDCVLPPGCCTDPNSELVKCPIPCPGGTCSDPKLEYNCRMACQNYGCQCKKGYVKVSNTDRTCIKLEHCPKK